MSDVFNHRSLGKLLLVGAYGYRLAKEHPIAAVVAGGVATPVVVGTGFVLGFALLCLLPLSVPGTLLAVAWMKFKQQQIAVGTNGESENPFALPSTSAEAASKDAKKNATKKKRVRRPIVAARKGRILPVSDLERPPVPSAPTPARAPSPGSSPSSPASSAGVSGRHEAAPNPTHAPSPGTTTSSPASSAGVSGENGAACTSSSPRPTALPPLPATWYEDSPPGPVASVVAVETGAGAGDTADGTAWSPWRYREHIAEEVGGADGGEDMVAGAVGQGEKQEKPQPRAVAEEKGEGAEAHEPCSPPPRAAQPLRGGADGSPDSVLPPGGIDGAGPSPSAVEGEGHKAVAAAREAALLVEPGLVSRLITALESAADDSTTSASVSEGPGKGEGAEGGVHGGMPGGARAEGLVSPVVSSPRPEREAPAYEADTDREPDGLLQRESPGSVGAGAWFSALGDAEGPPRGPVAVDLDFRTPLAFAWAARELAPTPTPAPPCAAAGKGAELRGMAPAWAAEATDPQAPADADAAACPPPDIRQGQLKGWGGAEEGLAGLLERAARAAEADGDGDAAAALAQLLARGGGGEASPAVVPNPNGVGGEVQASPSRAGGKRGWRTIVTAALVVAAAALEARASRRVGEGRGAVGDRPPRWTKKGRRPLDSRWL